MDHKAFDWALRQAVLEHPGVIKSDLQSYVKSEITYEQLLKLVYGYSVNESCSPLLESDTETKKKAAKSMIEWIRYFIKKHLNFKYMYDLGKSGVKTVTVAVPKAMAATISPKKKIITKKATIGGVVFVGLSALLFYLYRKYRETGLDRKKAALKVSEIAPTAKQKKKWKDISENSF